MLLDNPIMVRNNKKGRHIAMVAFEQLLKMMVLLLAVLMIQVHATIYQNPVIKNTNLPDPGAILHRGMYYVVSTSNFNNEEYIFPIHKSSDLARWENVGSVFTRTSKPEWADIDFWAPEIHVIAGKFLVYYAAREKAYPKQLCIGVAISDNITGPYKDLGRPLVRNDTVGNIDATLLYAPDGQYLVWKEDGNGCQPPIPTDIWAQKLSPDGLSFASKEKVFLLKNTLPWEGPLVEGPWIVKRNDTYYLFYSANAFYNNYYAVGVAQSKQPLGPYEKNKNPILVGNQQWRGPGHCSVINIHKRPDMFVMIYHAWEEGHEGGNNNRLMLLDVVGWDDKGWPYVSNGTPSVESHNIPTL